jgi:hypothetical protein
LAGKKSGFIVVDSDIMGMDVLKAAGIRVFRTGPDGKTVFGGC